VASAEPSARYRDSLTKACIVVDEPRNNIGWTSNPNSSKKPFFVASQNMLVPIVLVPTPTGNLIFSCAATLCPNKQDDAINSKDASIAKFVWCFKVNSNPNQHTIVETRDERQGGTRVVMFN